MRLNIITEKNKNKYNGKLVKVKLTNNYNVQNYQSYNELLTDDLENLNIQMGPYDLNGEYYNSDGTEGTSTRIADLINGMYILEKLNINDEQIYPDMDESNIRDIVKLKNNLSVHYLQTPRNIESFIESINNGTDHIGYYIEPFEPIKKEFFTKKHAKSVHKKRNKHAFTEFAKSKQMRTFPPDLKAHILTKMNIDGNINPTKINTLPGKVGGKKLKARRPSRRTSRKSPQKRHVKVRQLTKRKHKGVPGKYECLTCKKGVKAHFTGKEPSPKGLGYCAKCTPLNITMEGKDGNLWKNKKYSKGKRWVRV